MIDIHLRAKERCWPDSEDLLERYLLGHLPDRAGSMVGDHVAQCERCRAEMDELAVWIADVRGAFVALDAAEIEFQLHLVG